MMRYCWATSMLLLLVTTTGVAAASTYNPYQYDTTVPQFTPDGRLLQVEYAAKAIDQSLPLIVVPSLRLDDDDDDDDDTMCLLIALRTHGKVQERLVILPSSSDDGKAPTTVLALSGVLADSLALLKTIQDESLGYRRYYGGNTGQLSNQQVATAVAGACQQNACGGGIRPYGSTFVVAGTTTTRSGGGSVQILRTDASGAIGEISMGEGPIVIGGGSFGDLIRRRLEKEWKTLISSGSSSSSSRPKQQQQDDDDSNNNNKSSLADRLRKIIAICVEEDSRRSGSSDISNDDDEETNNIDSTSSSSATKKKKSTAAGHSNNGSIIYEIAAVSAKRGAYKFSRHQIQQLMNNKKVDN